MYRIAWLFLCLLMGLEFSVSYAEDRRVLFRIDGEETSVEEFEHYYTQVYAVSRVSVEQFLPHFLYYKLKVADAKRQSWDTITDFRLQCSALQNEILKSEKRGVPQKQDTLLNWVRFRQISFLLPQHASSEQERVARQRIDSVYTALKNGIPFEKLAQPYIKNLLPSPYLDGEWIPERCLIKEFTEQLSTLKKGNYSAPFFSPLGIHIVYLLDRRQGVYPSGATGNVAVQKVANSGPTEWKDSLLNKTRMELCQVSDGLLAAYWDKRHGGTKSGNISDKELQNYFESHKNDYTWDLPHFKGGVIHCLNKKVASKLKKRLKKCPLDKWNEEISAFSQENPECKVVVETGLFQIGTNPYVDKLAFKCGHFTPRTDLPYAFVLGKRLKKGPEDFQDVRDEVQRDYRLWTERAQMEELKRGFRIEINQDILKTVNCSGKK
ncbi:peptidylprolyl isomerase [Phocaeicola plebeius]|nr:peptidylprolyl isomerase [Phocaeicola plebeius]